MGTLATPLGFVLARQLGFSHRPGLLFALLLATSPYLVWYGQEAKMYALLLLTVTLAFLPYLAALAGSGVKWWLVFVVATTLSFYLHILAPLMLLVYLAIAVLRYHDMRHHWKAWLISMAAFRQRLIDCLDNRTDGNGAWLPAQRISTARPSGAFHQSIFSKLGK